MFKVQPFETTSSESKKRVFIAHWHIGDAQLFLEWIRRPFQGFGKAFSAVQLSGRVLMYF